MAQVFFSCTKDKQIDNNCVDFRLCAEHTLISQHFSMSLRSTWASEGLLRTVLNNKYREGFVQWLA